MRVLLAILLFGVSGAAMADEFGQRFGKEPPFALRDSLDPTTVFNVFNVEPAAGEEGEKLVVPADEEGAAAAPAAATDPESVTPGAGEKAADEEKPADKNGLVRVYPEPLKK